MLSGDTPQNTSAKISPRAEVLSRDHVSRRNYGGDCTPQEHDKLNAEMHKICDKPHGCKKTLSQEQIKVYLEIARQCAMARDKINSKCFAGGDLNHQNEAKSHWRSYQICTDLIKK